MIDYIFLITPVYYFSTKDVTIFTAYFPHKRMGKFRNNRIDTSPEIDSMRIIKGKIRLFTPSLYIFLHILFLNLVRIII